MLLNSVTSVAQITQLEHSATSYSGKIPDGPSVPQVEARFVNNTSDSKFVDFNPEIIVTAAFSNQTYNNAGGIADLKGSFFGGTTNSVSKSVVTQTVWRKLSSISDPENDMFTSNPTGVTGKGIDTDVNYGFNMFTTVEPLHTLKKNRSERYYFSTLTLTFNRAVSNPVLHIVGLGAFTKTDGKTLGFATELELQNRTGIALEKLSGSNALTVNASEILNNKNVVNAESASGAATGSIRVKGNNITQLVFKIYLRGDGHGDNWSNNNIFAGDQWLMAFSMNASSISGNIFDDGNALNDGKVNPIPANDGKGTNIGGQLHVNLLNDKNEIVATTDVADDGGYLFQDIIASSYPAAFKLVLSTSKTSKIGSLPEKWVFTGENLGSPVSAGNDSNADGMLESATLSSATSSIENANFGINKIPVADQKMKAITAPSADIFYPMDGSGEAPAVSGSDLEDGQLGGKGSRVVIARLPENAKLYYGARGSETEIITLNTPFTQNFDPSLFKIQFPGSVYKTADFNYAFIDAAGKQGSSAIYELIWTAPLPVTLIRFTAVKKESTVALNWSTTMETNSDRFEVEHSTNGKNWNTLGTVAATGESEATVSYDFDHREPTSGENLYRLKMIDLDGTFAYSRINSVNFESNTETAVYPNPAISIVKVKIDGQYDWSKISQIKIYDMSGKTIISAKIISNEIDVTGLPNGLYIVQVTRQNGFASNLKLVIKK